MEPAGRAHNAPMSTPDPGLDLHEWASEYASIEPDLEDDPAAALSELANLVRRILAARGFAVDDPVADDGEEPEVLAQFRAAQEVSRLVDSGADVDPGDIADSINGLRDIYSYLIEDRAAP